MERDFPWVPQGRRRYPPALPKLIQPVGAKDEGVGPWWSAVRTVPAKRIHVGPPRHPRYPSARRRTGSGEMALFQDTRMLSAVLIEGS